MRITVFILISILFFSCEKIELNQIIQKQSDEVESTEFNGYKVDKKLLLQSRLKDDGKEYWKNTQVLSDVVVTLFQKPHGNRNTYGVTFFSVATGDFNNDGYIDVFNGGVLDCGVQATPTFLIWNVTNKKFEEKNLLNGQYEHLGGPTKTVAVYLNDDDYVDLVCFSYIDECLTNPPKYKVRELISDGKGKYDVRELTTETPIFYHNGGDVGDLNNDGFPDLVVNGGGLMSILWGIPNFPYFDESRPAYFCSIMYGSSNGHYYPYKNDNGFGEEAPEIVQRHVWNTRISDVNKDGWNDLILSSEEDSAKQTYNYNRVILNLGQGRFNKSSIVKLPGNVNTSNNNDYIVDDITGDGLNDIIAAVNPVFGLGQWKIYVYVQNKNGEFTLDKNKFIESPPHYIDGKMNLIYCDYNKDGLKDVGFIDCADNEQFKSKTIFIRKGQFFYEESFLKYDSYLSGFFK